MSLILICVYKRHSYRYGRSSGSKRIVLLFFFLPEIIVFMAGGSSSGSSPRRKLSRTGKANNKQLQHQQHQTLNHSTRVCTILIFHLKKKFFFINFTTMRFCPQIVLTSVRPKRFITQIIDAFEKVISDYTFFLYNFQNWIYVQNNTDVKFWSTITWPIKYSRAIILSIYYIIFWNVQIL